MKTVPVVMNLLFGIGLLLFPEDLVGFFGLPDPGLGFWSSLLGAVFLGTGITELMRVLKDPENQAAVASTGAVTVNLCAALVLAGWLLGGQLELTTRSTFILWGLVLVMVGVSAIGFQPARRPG